MKRLRYLTLILLTAMNAPLLGADILLRETAVPTGSIVRLGDIAEIKTTNTALIARLARTPLMPTPAPGVVQHVRAQAIRDLLRAQGVALSQHRFGGAISVAVGKTAPSKPLPIEQPATAWRPAKSVAPQVARRNNSTGFRLSPTTSQRQPHLAIESSFVGSGERKAAKKQIEGPVNDWLQSHRGTPFTIHQIDLDDQQTLSLLDLRGRRLVAKPLGAVLQHSGLQQFRIAPVGNTEGQAIDVVVELVELQMGVVATTSIRRGELITAARVALQPLPPNHSDTYSSLELVLGKQASRAIRPNESLSSKNTISPLLVHRGETVTVFSGGGGVSVRLQAVARGDGRAGDLVIVEIPSRRERFDARVVGRAKLAILSSTSIDARFASNASQGGLQ